MIITLIGYRGTGKSTVARPLAARLGWTAVDADAELERRAGRSIRDIFASDGEPEFRRLERETLVDLLQRDRLVIAAGGGAILNPQTRADFGASGPVVWLQASVETIEQRLYGDPTTTDRRPNLTASGGRQEIEQMLKVREPYYRETASLIVATDRPLPGHAGCDAATLAELVEYLVTELSPQIGESQFGGAGQ